MMVAVLMAEGAIDSSAQPTTGIVICAATLALAAVDVVPARVAVLMMVMWLRALQLQLVPMPHERVT